MVDEEIKSKPGDTGDRIKDIILIFTMRVQQEVV
jgi:hypothetical protein